MLKSSEKCIPRKIWLDLSKLQHRQKKKKQLTLVEPSTQTKKTKQSKETYFFCFAFFIEAKDLLPRALIDVPQFWRHVSFRVSFWYLSISYVESVWNDDIISRSHFHSSRLSCACCSHLYLSAHEVLGKIDWI